MSESNIKKTSWRTVLGMILLPVLVLGIFVGLATSNAAPKGAIVNNDKPAMVAGEKMLLGKMVAEGMIEDPNIAWEVVDKGTAEKGLADGKYAATVTIPEDFTSAAASFTDMKGSKTKQSVLDIRVSDNTTLVDGLVAQIVNSVATDTVNTELTKAFTAGVFDGFNEISDSFVLMVDGTKQLADGSKQLKDGTKEASGTVPELVDGLNQLNAGGKELYAGTGELASGAKQLDDGVGELSAAVNNKDGLVDGVNQLDAGAAQLLDGLQQLNGLMKADENGNVLNGAAAGVQQIADGLASIKDQMSAVSKVNIHDPAAVQANDLTKQLMMGMLFQPGQGLVPSYKAQIDEVRKSVEGKTGLVADITNKVANILEAKMVTGITNDPASFIPTAEQFAKFQEELCPLPSDITLALDSSDKAKKKYAECHYKLAQLSYGFFMMGATNFAGGIATDGLDESGNLLPADSICKITGTDSTGNPIMESVDRPGQPCYTGGLNHLLKGAAGLNAGMNYEKQPVLLTGEDIKHPTGQVTGTTPALKDLNPNAKPEDTLAGAINYIATDPETMPALKAGLDQLAGKDGVLVLKDGVAQLKAGTSQLAGKDGALALQDGARQISEGLQQAAPGAAELSAGLMLLDDGAGQLADGTKQLADEVKKGSGEIPSFTPKDKEILSKAAANPVTKQDVVTPGTFAMVGILVASLLWGAALIASVGANRRQIAAAAGIGGWLSSLATPLIVNGILGVVLGAVAGLIGEVSVGVMVGMACVGAVAGLSFVFLNHALAAWLGNIGRALAGVLLGLTIVMGITAGTSAWVRGLGILSPIENAADLLRAFMAGGSVGGLMLGMLIFGAIGVAASAATALRKTPAAPASAVA